MMTTVNTDTEKQSNFRRIVNQYIKSPSICPTAVDTIITEFFRLEPIKDKYKDLFEKDELIQNLYKSWIELETNEDRSRSILLQYKLKQYDNYK